MKQLLQQIIQDFNNSENIDLYVTIFLSLLLGIGGFTGIVDFSWLAAGILATLAVLAFGSLIDRRSTKDVRELLGKFQSKQEFIEREMLEQVTHQLETIQSSINGIHHTGERFHWEKDGIPARDRIAAAQSIDWLAFSNRNTTRTLKNEVEACLRNGGHVRMLLIDPHSDLFDRLGHSAILKTDILEGTLKVCKRWLETIPNAKLEVRYLHKDPPYRAMIIDGKLPSGYARIRFITAKGTKERLTLRLTKQQDAQWFDFFPEQFDIYWQQAKGNNALDVRAQPQAG